MAVMLAVVLWSNMQESVFAALSHTVPIEIVCDTECTSTVLFTVVGTSCFPVFLLCVESAMHVLMDREVGIAVVRCCCDVNALMTCFIEQNEADIRMV